MATPHMRIDELNAVPAALFVERLGDIIEHSPWVAERLCAGRPFRDVTDLHARMRSLLREAPEYAQVAVIAAHPDLAGRLAREGRLTRASGSEQSSAGLDRLDAGERERFDNLNEAYRRRFAFPFVICVRDNTKDSVLAAMEQRLHNDRQDEIAAALEEIAKIARWRLSEIVTD
jgi:2-oxo-4-hydroxy-4-carboxy-5-ureidoimidazoline decarboxylase